MERWYQGWPHVRSSIRPVSSSCDQTQPLILPMPWEKHLCHGFWMDEIQGPVSPHARGPHGSARAGQGVW